MKPQQTRGQYYFGEFCLDASEHTLSCNNETIPITQKQFELLFFFVENPGRVAKKDELLDAVWSDSFVAESTLARNVSWLRKKFRECSIDEPIIETIPKLGYRFAAEVTHNSPDENVLIVEEQSVQHFCGEETIAFEKAAVGQNGERQSKEPARETTNILSKKIFIQLRRSFILLIFLLIVSGFAVLARISFVSNPKNPERVNQSADRKVKSKKTIRNFVVSHFQPIVNTGINVLPGDIIEISAEGEVQSKREQTLPLIAWIGTKTDKKVSFPVSKNGSVTAERGGYLYFAVKNRRKNENETTGEIVISVALTRPGRSGKTPIKIGSVVNLKNQRSPKAGYLDAWGQVKNKPEFSIVPTELNFVSTHPDPNRENGSGGWKIISATGKKVGETLVYGDKIHLKNMYPGAGYLDNCGWVKDMPVFKDFVEFEKFAVFTTPSKDRDNGSGTWIVSSNSEFDGSPVLERAGISLENGFPGGGYLDTAGSVKKLPAFNDYEGSLLVFIHESSTSRHSNSGIWTITTSKTVLK